jgi:hypothetical protein
MLQRKHQIVLREAARAEDLTTCLNGDTLVALWRDPFPPKGVRRAWEDRHPVPRTAAAPAARCRPPSRTARWPPSPRAAARHGFALGGSALIAAESTTGPPRTWTRSPTRTTA